MKYIFKYLDAARNEVDMGELVDGEEVPFSDKDKCRKEMNQMSSYGALTTGPIEVDDDYKLFKPEY